MARKYVSLNVVDMYATLTLDQWKTCLLQATKTNNVEKLMAWRYGLQAGLSDAVARGFKDAHMDMWVMKRCRDLEKCVKFIIKKKHPDPKVDLKKDPKNYMQRIKDAKKARDRELENFFMRSNF